MPDSKQLRWAGRYGTEAEADTAENPTAVPVDEPAANDADGWQQYRRWISKAPAPRGRRSGIDPSLYSWKGYREWTDQVKRNWCRDETDDKD